MEPRSGLRLMLASTGSTPVGFTISPAFPLDITAPAPGRGSTTERRTLCKYPIPF